VRCIAASLLELDGQGTVMGKSGEGSGEFISVRGVLPRGSMNEILELGGVARRKQRGHGSTGLKDRIRCTSRSS
jgi:hypothetical protein